MSMLPLFKSQGTEFVGLVAFILTHGGTSFSLYSSLGANFVS